MSDPPSDLAHGGPPPASDPTDSPLPSVPAAARTGRRAFFRQFSRDAVQITVQAAGAAGALQRDAERALGAALGLIEPPGERAPSAPNASIAPPAPRASQIALRVEGDSILLLDQQHDPDEALVVACSTGYDVARELLSRTVDGAPLLGAVSAYAVWLTVIANRAAAAAAMRNRIRTVGATLRAARTNVATIPWAVERMLDAWDREAADAADPATREERARAAADAVHEALAAAMTLIARVGPPPRPGAGRLNIVALDSPGMAPAPAASLALAEAWSRRGEDVHVWLPSTRANPRTTPLAAHSLTQAGVPFTVVPDSALAWILATTPVDVVLLGADRIAADGATTATVGTYGAAALARGHGVPCWVVSPLAAFDPLTPDAAASGTDAEPWPSHAAASAAGAPGAGTRGALQDVTPPDLIDAIVTEAGVLRAPFGQPLRQASAGG